MSRWKPKSTCADEDNVFCPHCGEENHSLTEELLESDEVPEEGDEQELRCDHCGGDYTVQVVVKRTFTMEAL